MRVKKELKDAMVGLTVYVLSHFQVLFVYSATLLLDILLPGQIIASNALLEQD